MKVRRRRRHMSPELQRRIEEEAALGYMGKEIFEKMPTWKEWNPDKPVGLKTVQNVVLDVNRRDKSGPWSVTDKDQHGAFKYTPEEARGVLNVLADLVVCLARKRGFSKEEAKWVLRISNLAPELDCLHVWRLAFSYLTLENKGLSTEGLDAYLAFKPWVSKNRCENYGNALKLGLVKHDGLAESFWREDKFGLDFLGIATKNLTQVERDDKSMAEQMNDLANSEIRKAQENKKMQLIRKQDPILAQKIDEAKEKGFWQWVGILEWLNERLEREEKFTPQERDKIFSEVQKSLPQSEKKKFTRQELDKMLSETDKFTPQERDMVLSEMKDAYSEYRRLMDSFVERKKTRRKTKTTSPNSPSAQEAK